MKTLAIVNVVVSFIARESDYVFYKLAGPELAEVLTIPSAGKTIFNMVQCKFSGGYFYAIAPYGNYAIEETANFVTYISKVDRHVEGSLAVIPLQLLEYYISVVRGLDVDNPKNLA